MSSADLKKFETEVLDAVLTKLSSRFFQQVDNKDVKKYFRNAKFDGVYLKEKKLIIVEVALGGSVEKLKAGPMRKMKTDILKLISSDLFLIDNAFFIEKRILYVRKGIKGKLNVGWLADIISNPNNKIEIMEHDFGESEEEIRLIRESSPFEKADDRMNSEDED